MYLWVVLATFISLLYGYNLTVRADLDRVHAETKASVFIAKLRAQDNAFKIFLLNNPSAVAPDLTFNEVWESVNNSSGGSSEPDPNNTEQIYQKIKNYVPLGFEPSDDVHSMAYCLDDDGSKTTDSTGTYGCASASKVYLVSWRPVNKRWMHRHLNVPNSDFMKALSQTSGYGDSIGYTTGTTLKGGYITSSIAEDGSPLKTFNQERDLPQAIADDLSDKCKEDKPCIVTLHKI